MIAARTATHRTARGGAGHPELPASVPALAAVGVALVVAAVVAATPVGSGDYGQWLMASRAFAGESVPAYRELGGVPPLVPLAIAWTTGVVGDPLVALRIVGFLIVAAMGVAVLAAGTALDGRPLTGLVAVVLALLVTDRFLELLAFGGLLQAAAIAWLLAAVAAFIRAAREPAVAARWWIVGCGALLATCLTHVPTATSAIPVGVAAAAIAIRPGRGEPLLARVWPALPLLGGLAAIAAYWLLVVVPASVEFVANPASLAYRGPERVPQILAAYPPTAAIALLGVAAIGWWAARAVRRRRLPARTDPWALVAAWAVAAWGLYAISALGGAATDFPRFVPILVAPLVVAAAGGLGAAAHRLARRRPAAVRGERGLVAVGLAIVLVAPFSIARFQTEAQGYLLPDDRALAAIASWTDERLVPGVAVLAPVREAKWLEGLTGRATLFSSQVRYAFRPVEWERSLAADALLRGDLTLVNEAFTLTMTDGAPAPDGVQPRALIIAANHGGEAIDLLRLVPASVVLADASGGTIATLPALAPDGFEPETLPTRLVATTRWTGVRAGTTVGLEQTVTARRGADSFDLSLALASVPPSATGDRGGTARPVAVRFALAPFLGSPIVDAEPVAGGLEVTFPRLGRSEPRLRLDVTGGTIRLADDGTLVVTSQTERVTLRITALTVGGASATLTMLDPAALVETYDVGAAILRRDPAYDARRARLERLGFHVALAEGPYVVLVRDGAARPASTP